MIFERDVMVALRDGVRLATDIYRPDGPKPAPVVLERTPYGKHLPSRSELTAADPQPRSRAEVAQIFVERGIAVVYQDVRGRHGSEGRFEKYVSDAEDGEDCLAWLRGQPWCDGTIGTMGLSYAAHTQAALASMGPSGLACMVLDSGGFSNAFNGGIRQGGAFELKQATWAFKQAALSPHVRDDPELADRVAAIDIRQWMSEMPWEEGRSPLSLTPDYEAYLFEQWRHGRFDDYWKRPGLYAIGHHDDFPNGPMLHMSSWYDPYPRTATENYVGLKAAGKGPQFLILGPWTHGDRSLCFAGDVDFGPEALFDGQIDVDFLAFRARWFERWLKGVENGVETDSPVRIFVMGGGSGRRTPSGRLDHGGRWREESDWPLPGTHWTKFHLHADGSLGETAPCAEIASLGYRFDPNDPVPTIGGAITSGAPVVEGGAYDQVEAERFFGSRVPGRPLAERADVLVFQTEPLAGDLEVTGPVSARLWISSDCPDTDFTIKLIDVHPPSPDYPNGFAMNLTDGILRARYRDSVTDPCLMTPGETYEVLVEAFPTSNLFKAGHRLRLDISSSNFPHFDVNPNTGAAEGSAGMRRVAYNQLHLDSARPSHLNLPIIPKNR